MSPSNLNQRLRSSSAGNDVSTAHAKGNWRVQRAGRTIEVFTEAETASDEGSSAEISHVIIANGNGVLVRVSSGSRSTGRGMMDPSATSRIIAPGAAEGIVTLDRAARRAGEARSTSMMLITPQPAGPLK